MGTSTQTLAALKKNLVKLDGRVADMTFYELPFRSVDQFDYKEIADRVNVDGADIVWVALGAPKQEIFMSKLKPYLNRGVMIAVGAAFKFYSGLEEKRAPQWMLKLRLEWLYRAFNEPQKNVPRYANFLKILPRLIKEEKQKIKVSRSAS